MLERISILIIGIFLVLIGVNAFFARGFYSWRYGRYIDMGKYHSVIGVIFVIVGMIFIATLFKRIRNKARILLQKVVSSLFPPRRFTVSPYPPIFPSPHHPINKLSTSAIL